MIDSNQRVMSTANKQIRSSGIFILLLGVFFCLFGFVPFFMSGSTDILFMGVLGLVFSIYGITRLLKKSQYYPEKNK
jgi:uncharacterized membrane protein HdeD (DUF308 family)